MTQTLFQLLLTIIMYSIMGTVVGVGITIVEEFPKVGEWLKKHPILGWTLAFAVGSTLVTFLVGLVELTALEVVQHFLG
jgi:hypothetical protein